MSNIIIAAVGDWNRVIFKKFRYFKNYKIYFTSSQKNLIKLSSKLKPKYVFFVHWRNIMSDKFTEKNFSICFHMTNLPFGRGGSPLQNLILLNKKNTKLTAFKMNDQLDSGDIILKKNLPLSGSAHEIYRRSSLLSLSMIKNILTKKIKLKKQKGKKFYFKRRQPHQSEIKNFRNIKSIYNFIRMLDAPGYPKAYIYVGKKKKIIFQDANISKDKKFLNCNLLLSND